MQLTTRINTAILVFIALTGIAIVAMLATGVRGGPLDPPAAPGATDGVRQPGIPISSIPYTIAQPGSYYVTRNLTNTIAFADGITITAQNVVLDLGGFTLDGGVSGGVGVYADPNSQSVTVRNGTARSWSTGFLIASRAAVVEDVTTRGGGFGISIENGGTLTRCAVTGSAIIGVNAIDAAVSDCSVTSSGDGFSLSYSSIRGCTAHGNTGIGINGGLSTISDCTASSNGQGFQLVGSSLHECTAGSNTGTGIKVYESTVDGCVSSGNQTGIDADGSTLRNNNVTANKQNGIQVSGPNSLVVDNNVTRNSTLGNASGIFVNGNYNRIEANHVTGNNGFGIYVAADGANTIISNSAKSNSLGEYVVFVGNDFGPLTAAASSGAWSNLTTP